MRNGLGQSMVGAKQLGVFQIRWLNIHEFTDVSASRARAGHCDNLY